MSTYPESTETKGRGRRARASHGARGRATRLTTWQNDGLTFEVSDVGPLTGEPVICLHGFPQDASAYDQVAGQLIENGMRVLVPNQRGYSPAARPTHAATYGLRQLTGDVAALLDAAGLDSAHVVGHDWGGAVAWALASRYGNRVRSLVVLSTPHPAALRSASSYGSQALRSAYVGFFQIPAVPERLLTARGGAVLRRLLSLSGLDQSRARHYADRMQQPGAATAALSWYRALVRAERWSPGPIAVPTTFLAGRRDPFFNRTAVLRTADHMTGPYRLVGLDAGHWLPEGAPADVFAAVRHQVIRASGSRQAGQ
jgi:pimeloyl-ACP methyl ester carboxylesterase